MADYTKEELTGFIHESNRIEGIVCASMDTELAAAGNFFGIDTLEVDDLCGLVSVFQPGAVLRERTGLDIRVGSYRPPPGGPAVVEDLERLLIEANTDQRHPYTIHEEYEAQHPFTDGNGRSGRLLWAWQMLKFGYAPGLELGFLHAWYYQSLQHNH